MGCLSGGCGSYVSLWGGWNELDDLADDNIRIEFNDGIALGGAIGRRLGTSFRGELETSVRTNTSGIATDGTTTADISGHLYTYAGMANLYYDAHQLQMLGITPYVGAGLGLAVIDGDFTIGTTDVDLNDEDFAYQFIIGGSKQIRAGVAAFSEYRSFTVDTKPELDMDTFVFGLRIDR
jgi:opacity protein-like surface antigen